MTTHKGARPVPARPQDHSQTPIFLRDVSTQCLTISPHVSLHHLLFWMTVTLPQGVPLPTRPSWTFRSTVWTCSLHRRWERSIFPSSPTRPLYCRRMCLDSCYDFLGPQISAILAAHPSTGKCLSLWVMAQSSPLDHKALLTHTYTSSSSVKTHLLHLHRKAHPPSVSFRPQHFILLAYLWISASKRTIYTGIYLYVYMCVCVCVYMWYSVCSEYRLAELMRSPNIYSFFPMIIVCAKSCWRIRSGVCHKYLHNSVQGR